MKPKKIEYFVGYEKTDEGYQLYTIYRQAIDLLAFSKIEFEFDPQEKYMRSTSPIKKLPKVGNRKSGYVTFYDIKKINKKIPKGVRKAVTADFEELNKINLKINKLRERYERDLDALNCCRDEAKARIRTRLKVHGAVTKVGRFFHRAMLINDVRVYLKTDFAFCVELLTAEQLKEIAKGIPAKYRKLLDTCVKTTGVLIDPVFYEKTLKKKIKPQDRKAFVTEEKDVDDQRLEEEILPKIPYAFRLLFWWMKDQLDENGEHIAALHTQTYHVTNPECQQCGGKFIKKTNECRDCGLKSFQAVDDKIEPAKKSKIVAKPKRSAKLNPVRIVRGKPADTRGVPAKGYSRD